MLLLVGTLVHAVCLIGHPSVAEEYKSAQAVLVARVIGQHEVSETGDGFFYDGTMYTLKIERAFHGSIGARADVFSENTSGRLPMVAGQRYHCSSASAMTDY